MSAVVIREQPPPPYSWACSFTYTVTSVPDPVYPPVPEVEP